MNTYSNSNLWTPNMNNMVFDWETILANWNDTLVVPQCVQRLLDNLKAASQTNGSHNPGFSKFLRYLNYEQPALAWFLYECLALRWMGSYEIRLDYVRELVDEIENLDGYFPKFPGSPLTNMTIRNYVNSHLSDSELAAVQMMPPLVHIPVLQTPVRRPSAASAAPLAPARPSYARPTETLYPSQTPLQSIPLLPRSTRKEKDSEYCNYYERFIMLNLVRNSTTDKSTTDDVITIAKKRDPAADGSDTYKIRYNDKSCGQVAKIESLSYSQVLTFMSTMLRFLNVDEQPFENLQVTLPCLPAIAITPKNLTSQTRDLIYDGIEFTMNNWPSA